MLNIVSPDEMRQVEQQATAAGATLEALMEQAGTKTAEKIVELPGVKRATIVCGRGNNGGDGYVVARKLLESGFTVQVVQSGELDPASLTKKERRRFEARGGKIVEKFIPPEEGVVIDALFGTGFHGRQNAETIALIEAINRSKVPIISVDVPSGLNANDGSVDDIAVHATLTYTMESPKLGFFLNRGWDHVGKVISLPIGLKISHGSLQLLELKDVMHLMPKIVPSRHKYSAGHVVGIAGSHGMAGAALMSAFSALKTGAGITHLLHPDSCSLEFAGQPLEVVRVGYKEGDFQLIKSWLDKAAGAYIGPGMGLHQDALLEALWPHCKGKVVVDADALSWLAKAKKERFGPLPNAILTPHLGELQRFFDTKESISLDFIKRVQIFVDNNQTNLILKGGPSFLFSHGKTPIVMTQADPGMATAGAGDVLTGILASLLAQGNSPYEAMLLGSWIHGTAGKLAAQEETSYCMTATSIIAKLPAAIKSVIS